MLVHEQHVSRRITFILYVLYDSSNWKDEDIREPLTVQADAEIDWEIQESTPLWNHQDYFLIFPVYVKLQVIKNMTLVDVFMSQSTSQSELLC